MKIASTTLIVFVVVSATACGSRVATRILTVKQPQAVVPACAHATYGADGTVGPLFCVIVNPVALQAYSKIEPHLFALGPDASPAQVMAALKADSSRSTSPIECESYLITVWQNHWHFGTVPTLSDCSGYVTILDSLQRIEAGTY